MVYPWEVSVRGGAGVHAEDGNGNTIHWANPPTFDDFFNTIQAQIQCGCAESISVVFEPTYGYPTNIYTHYNNGTVFDVNNREFVFGEPLMGRRNLKEEKPEKEGNVRVRSTPEGKPTK